MLQTKAKFKLTACHGNKPLSNRLYHLQLSRPIVARPRVRVSNLALYQQQRSISIIPTVVRVAFSAARLPLFLAGSAVAGATIATNKFQDLADKSSEFLNDAKSILSGLGESIEDIDIKVPEMNIKLSDLVNDVLASAKDKTRSINHIFNSAFPAKPAEEVVVVEKKGQDTEAKDTSTNNSSLQAIQEMKQSMMEEEEEEIDEEALAQDAAARMKNQDYQFMLLCRKFANIRNTLISINHRVIPFIPSIVMIGSRHIQQDNGISVLESILGQPFLTRDLYGNNTIVEYSFINNSELQEALVTIYQQGEEKAKELKLEEAEKAIKKLLAEQNSKELGSESEGTATTLSLTIQGPNVPYLNLFDIPEGNRFLCEKYIGNDPHSIIMAVYDTSLPIKDSLTAKICDKYDPLGRRTVGILKKNARKEAPISDTDDESDNPKIKNEHVPAASVVKDYHPPLSLGYININHHDSQIDKEKERRLLRHQMLGVIEQSMGRSIYSIVDSIKSELEETSYLFKVIYNDHEMTASSYLTDSMDELKLRFKEFASCLGKPQLRYEVRHLLEQNVLNVCAEQYWSDAKILELAKANADDFYWLYKMDLASAAITKSGIGRITTQLVMDVVMNNMERLVKIEPFQYHPKIQKQIVDLTGEMLRHKFLATSDQVENTIKPYKYEVEVTDVEWKDGVRRTVAILEKELAMCEDMLWTLKKSIGKKRLRSAIKRVLDDEKSQNFDAEEEQQPHKLLEKAKEALFLQDRAMIIKYRIAALKSRQCKSSENKQFCPEAFLNIIAEKLTYTAVMFIQIELLNDFFFNFPLEVIDNRIIYPMSPAQIEKFAKENPSVQKHLILQERKMKLEEVMDMLNYLVKRHDISPPSNRGYTSPYY